MHKKIKIFTLLVLFVTAIPTAFAQTAAQTACISSSWSNYKAAKQSAAASLVQTKQQALDQKIQNLKAADGLKDSAKATVVKQARAAYRQAIATATTIYHQTVQNIYAHYKTLKENCIENADINY